MGGKAYSIKPRAIKQVDTAFRKITTKFPVPESVPVLEELHRHEPRAMSGQPPIIWDRAEGCQVYDAYGNMWLDWSSGVLVTNIGHGHPKIVDAVVRQAQSHLLHNYCFPSELRARLAGKLVALAPPGLDKVFLLTTGSETTECAVKLARTYGRKIGGDKKIGIVSYEGAFHGRTLGAQLIGGIPALKEWIGNLDPDFHQVPFPGDFRNPHRKFEDSLALLKDNRVGPERIAAVITETYQGGNAAFAPVEYMKELARWCSENKILLIFDEVQAGFGRTGKMFAFEHYGVTPDLICIGKGISSSLPLSAVLGRSEIMDHYGPGEMTSTHTGNPICVAAALANLDVLAEENLVENARVVGEVLQDGLERLRVKYSDFIAAAPCRGLVAGLHIVQPGGSEPFDDLAFDIVGRAAEKGLLLFAPVGRAMVKIAPPLCISEEALRDGITALDEAIGEAVSEHQEKQAPVKVS